MIWEGTKARSALPTSTPVAVDTEAASKGQEDFSLDGRRLSSKLERGRVGDPGGTRSGPSRQNKGREEEEKEWSEAGENALRGQISDNLSLSHTIFVHRCSSVQKNRA